MTVCGLWEDHGGNHSGFYAEHSKHRNTVNASYHLIVHLSVHFILHWLVRQLNPILPPFGLLRLRNLAPTCSLGLLTPTKENKSVLGFSLLFHERIAWSPIFQAMSKGIPCTIPAGMQLASRYDLLIATHLLEEHVPSSGSVKSLSCDILSLPLPAFSMMIRVSLCCMLMGHMEVYWGRGLPKPGFQVVT